MVQLMTADYKRVRLEKCRRIVRRITPLNWERILFTDERLVAIEQAHNHQNDRSWRSEASGASVILKHRQNPKSVMVWGGICATGKTPLVFVFDRVNIDQNVYHRDILDPVVVPWARRNFGQQQCTLQQDSAPADRAKATEEWCMVNFPDFITSAEWSSYSPDLNHMHYSIWRPGPVLSPTKIWRL